MLKFLVILCLSHLSDSAFRDRERWMSLLLFINNTFDCRKIIMSEYLAYDVETQWRAEHVLHEYSNIKSMMPTKSLPRAKDFGIDKKDEKYQDFLFISKKLNENKNVTIVNEPIRDAIQYYLQDKILAGATRGKIYNIIKRAENKMATRYDLWEFFIED